MKLLRFANSKCLAALGGFFVFGLGSENKSFAQEKSPRGAQAATPRAGQNASTPPSLSGTSGARTKLANSGAKIDVKERTDNVVTQKKQKKSKREKAEETGNRVKRSDIEAIALQKALGSAIVKESTYMEKLLPRLPKQSPQRPEIMRRLIENSHQQAILTFFNESRAYDAAWKKWDLDGRRGVEPEFRQTESKTWTSKVVQRSQQFITEYPKHKSVDEAYFQIAYALDQMGDSQSAAGYFSQLVAKFPNSKRVPDAQYALGEFYFTKQDFKKALTAYTQVTRFTRAPIYPWAVYKIAWCHYNTQDYPNAKGSFQRVVALAQESGNELTPGGKIKLKEEALRDLVLVFAELQDLDGAEQYYSSVGGDKYYGEMLSRLADILRERGEYDKSVVVLKRFLNRSPLSLKAAEIQIQVVDTSNLKVDKKLLWSEVRYLLKNYGDGSPWAQKNAQAKDFKESSEAVHSVAITYPKKMHAASQKDNNRYLSQQAEEGYRIYLEAYPSRPEAREARFHLAELQYQQSRYTEASKNFWIITQTGADPTKNPFFQKSANYLLSAAYLEVETEIKVLRARPAKLKQEPIPIPQTFETYSKVCDSFIKWFPKDKAVLDCKVDTAEIYLKHNRYDEAEKRLLVISKDFKDRKEGAKAAEVLLWLTQDDPKKLVVLVNELMKYPEYQKGDLGKRLREIKHANRFIEIASIEKSGNNSKAAEEFEKLAKEGGSEADRAWYNAAVNYKKASDFDRATNAFTMVYTKYPKSPVAADAMASVIEMSESRLQLEKAAQVSSLFLKQFPQDKRGPVIQRESCFIYDALNNPQMAETSCGAAAKAGGPGADEAAKALAEMYERNGRYADFVRVVDTMVLKTAKTPSDQIVFLGRAAEAERKGGKSSAAKARDAQILAVYSKAGKSIQGQALSVVAGIEYQKHVALIGKFRSLKLEARKADGSDLTASIESKQKLLQQVEQNFKKVVSIGDAEWGIASLFTIGFAYEDFGKDLQNPPMPPGAPAEVAAKLRAQLQSFGKPLVLKSGEYYKEAASVVSKFGVYTDYSQKTSAALARVNPQENRKLDEWIPDALFVGSQLVYVGKVKPIIEALGSGGAK